MAEKKIQVDPLIAQLQSDSSVPLKKIPIPYKIGPYRTKGLLKKGGSCVLYLGVQPDSNELLALKVLLPKYMSHPEMMSQFMKEAQIIETANHPNIVKLYGHGQWEGGLYIAMEFVQGISLRNLILQDILSFKRSLELILEVALAISHLHAHKIVHRDLKPSNILLSQEGGVKVIDFGISRLMEDPKTVSTKKRVMGTLTYMSPEQKVNPMTVSYPTDIYALAIITYELCIGRLSYGVLQLSKLPKGLRKILEKALKENPEDRHLTIDEFIEDLNEYIHTTFDENEELFEFSLKEISEFYSSAYLTSAPPKGFFEQKLQVGLKNSKGLLLSHLYCDYLNLAHNHLGILMGCPEKKGAEGLLANTLMKGMIQGLISKRNFQSEQMVEQAKDFLEEMHLLLEKNDQKFTSLSFFILSLEQDLAHVFSFGQTLLWLQRVSSSDPQKMQMPALEADNWYEQNFSFNLNLGDRLFFFTPLNEETYDEECYKKSILEGSFNSGNKQAELILKSMAKLNQKELHQISMTLMTLQRKG